jgi:hypothetical protein
MYIDIYIYIYLYRYIYNNISTYYLPGKTKNVMLLTTTVPIMGVTKDDQKKKPGTYRRYDYRLVSFSVPNKQIT